MALRPLTLGDFFGGAIATVRHNPGATVGMSALVTTLFMLVPAVLALVLGATGALPPLDLGGGADGTGPGLAINAASLVSGVFSAMASVVVTGLIMRVVERAVVGEHTTAAQAWRLARGSLPRLVGLVVTLSLGLVLVIGLPTALGALVGALTEGVVLAVVLGILGGLLGAVLAVFLYVRFALLAAPNLVLEGTGVLGSLQRAAVLSRGEFWRLLGISLLAGLAAYLASSVVSIPFTLVGVVGLFAFQGSWFSTVALLLSSFASTIVTGAVVTPFSGGVAALQYHDQRFRKEGYDIELLDRTLRRS